MTFKKWFKKWNTSFHKVYEESDLENTWNTAQKAMLEDILDVIRNNSSNTPVQNNRIINDIWYFIRSNNDNI